MFGRKECAIMNKRQEIIDRIEKLTPKQFEDYQVNFLYGKNVSNVKNLNYKVLRNKEEKSLLPLCLYWCFCGLERLA